MLPQATTSGVNTSVVDVLFTATSATCVTGLAVQDTGGYFSIFGQLVILFLIQIGGLGIMTFSVSLALFLKKAVGMKQEVLMQDLLDYDTLSDIKHYILGIIKMTFFLNYSGRCCFLSHGGSVSRVSLPGYTPRFFIQSPLFVMPVFPHSAIIWSGSITTR